MFEKRKRSPNWLPSEKTLLLELVEAHFNVIENKKTDGVSMRKKLAEWNFIAKQYNSQTTHCTRTAGNLKSQWEYMKKHAKKEESYNRMRRIQTGDEPPNQKKEDPHHVKVMSLIKKNASGVTNSSDSDNLEFTHNNEPQVILSEESDLHNQDLEIDNIETKNTSVETNGDIIQDWRDDPLRLNTPHPTSLQTKTEQGNFKKSFLLRRRPQHTTTTSSKFHETLIDAIDFHKGVAEQEDIKATEMHELDIAIKKEQLKQERLKTRILLLDLKLKKRHLLKDQ